MISLTDEIKALLALGFSTSDAKEMVILDRQTSMNSKEKTSPAKYEPSAQMSSHTKMNNKIVKAANVLVPP